MSSDESSDESSEESVPNNHDSELDRLKRECKAMVKLLKRLREEEQDLREKNEMLAREALQNGFQIDNLEVQPPKRRLKSPGTKKDGK